MESDLAALADLVIIIVESAGTFAELGAFSLSDPLRKKVLPIVDAQFRDQPSFISTGPLRWIDAESAFAETIYVSLPKILEAASLVNFKAVSSDSSSVLRSPSNPLLTPFPSSSSAPIRITSE
jgi:hypothetical protein